MINKTRSLWFVMVLIVTLVVAGCGTSQEETTETNDQSQESESNTANETESEEKELAWPTDKITIVVPFGAGGSMDTVVRGIAPFLSEELGVDVAVENKKGASGQVGSTYFAKATPDDGSYFFGGTQLYLSSNIVLQDADFSIDDYSMINFEQFDPITVTVHKDSPYQTFEELINAIKENPGELSLGTIYGGPLHLTGVLLEDKLDLDYRTVMYDGGGEMRNALLGQQVDFMIGNAKGDVAIADNARVLAIASDEPLSIWPDTPALNDALQPFGVKIPYVGSARFFAATTSFKEKHPELFDRFVEAYKNILESDEYQAHLEKTGAADVTKYRGPEASDKLNKELHQLLLDYKDKLKK